MSFTDTLNHLGHAIESAAKAGLSEAETTLRAAANEIASTAKARAEQRLQSAMQTGDHATAVRSIVDLIKAHIGGDPDPTG